MYVLKLLGFRISNSVSFKSLMNKVKSSFDPLHCKVEIDLGYSLESAKIFTFSYFAVSCLYVFTTQLLNGDFFNKHLSNIKKEKILSFFKSVK